MRSRSQKIGSPSAASAATTSPTSSAGIAAGKASATTIAARTAASACNRRTTWCATSAKGKAAISSASPVTRTLPMTTSTPSDEVPLRVLSLGAGVQSSTLALMIAAGEVEPVDCAIFADTQSEPRAVYEWLDWLERQLPFPVHRVSKGSLRQNILDSVAGGRFAGAPFYTTSDTPRGGGMLRRQCTREFKVEPITKKLREL